MGLPVVVFVEPFSQSSFELVDILVRPQVNAFMFDRAPQPLDEHVVHPPALAIHAHLGPGILEGFYPRPAGKLRALVRVENFRSSSCPIQGFAQGGHTERAIKGVGASKKAPRASSNPSPQPDRQSPVPSGYRSRLRTTPRRAMRLSGLATDRDTPALRPLAGSCAGVCRLPPIPWPS